MRMIRKTMLALSSAIMFAIVAIAVTAGTANAQQPAARSINPLMDRGGQVRVQVRVTLFVPGPVDDSDASFKAQEQARRKLYESAARECGVLHATIAAQCRIESINLSVSRYHNGQQGEGFNATGNFNFRVTLK
jgi:hypothetical protein